jgi:hypothetical protein
VKHLCISIVSKKILYTSRNYPGTVHDKVMLEEESQKARLPDSIKKLFDLGFYGIGKEYNNVIMPNKKPKGKSLKQNEKRKNRIISRVRVKIENAFAGVKRLRIVYNVSRIKRDYFENLIFTISCGLWNYYLVQEW